MSVETPDTLGPVHIYNRVGPKLPKRVVFTRPATNNEVYSKSIGSGYLHGRWEAVKRNSLSQGLVTSFQLLVPSSI